MAQEEQNVPDKFKEYYEDVKRKRIDRLLINIVWPPALLAYLACTKDGREMLSDPEIRRLLFNREGRTGLLEDAIIGPTLYHPLEEGTALTCTSAPAGRWVAYDFNRPMEFGPKARQLHRGRLFAFPLEEIIPNTPDHYTPTAYLELLDITHVFQVETPPVEQLVEQGLVRQTTYQKAFEEASAGARYRQTLSLRGIAEAPIYQITPKGNGLIFLDSDTGTKTEERRPSKVPLPTLGFGHAT